ncbi:unnamed protein product [Caenorhabditis angaria]|uniref:Uncharacterized protein n=1 Tax=Caenorhabditis angaria TaxID=860376 RepID=A0A9P1IHS1_9PELO|nr:unnamed protein product [Caenorhabditis angaria]
MKFLVFCALLAVISVVLAIPNRPFGPLIYEGKSPACPRFGKTPFGIDQLKKFIGMGKSPSINPFGKSPVFMRMGKSPSINSFAKAPSCPRLGKSPIEV